MNNKLLTENFKMKLYSILFALLAVSCNYTVSDKESVKNDKIVKDTVLPNDSSDRKDSIPAEQKKNLNKDTVSHNSDGTVKKRDFIKEGYVKAKVRNMMGLDGCGFLLVLDNGEKLEPTNLDKQYMKDGIKLWIKFKPTGNASICMAGTVVCLSATIKINEE